jgi:hypothetical protein
VLESTRKKEAEVKKDTIEQLEAFRRRQEEAERKALEAENAAGPVAEDTPQWNAASRKRKKSEKDGALLKGVKLRKASTGAGATTEAKKIPVTQDKGRHAEREGSKTPSESAKQAQHSPRTAAEEIYSAYTVEGPKAPAPVKPPRDIAWALGYESSDDED